MMKQMTVILSDFCTLKNIYFGAKDTILQDKHKTSDNINPCFLHAPLIQLWILRLLLTIAVLYLSVRDPALHRVTPEKLDELHTDKNLQ